MKKKIIANIMTVTMITGAFQTAALAATTDVKENTIATTVSQAKDSVVVDATTSAAVQVQTTQASVSLSIDQDQLVAKDALPIEQPVVQDQAPLVTDTIATTSAAVTIDNVVVRLDTQIEGAAVLGKTITVNVTGYNATAEKVDLDSSKLTYEWFANGKEVGKDKELTISEDMVGQGINCTVNYPDDVEVIK